MGAYIISIDVPTQATLGQEICPGVLVGNNSEDAVSVAVSWAEEAGPEGIGSDESGYTDMTLLGGLGSGFHEQEKIYPSVKLMPGSDVHWGITVWTIGEDGITWNKVVTRSFTIENMSSGGEGGESWLSAHKWWVVGGAAVTALLATVGIGMTKRKK